MYLMTQVTHTDNITKSISQSYNFKDTIIHVITYIHIHVAAWHNHQPWLSGEKLFIITVSKSTHVAPINFHFTEAFLRSICRDKVIPLREMMLQSLKLNVTPYSHNHQQHYHYLLYYTITALPVYQWFYSVQYPNSTTS